METLNRILFSRPSFYVTCLLKGLYGLMAVGVAVMLNVVVEAVCSAESAQSIITIGIAAFVFILVDALCRAASEVSNSKYAVKAVGSLRSKMMESIFSMNMKEFSELDSGDYINRTTTDLSLIQEQYVVQIPNIVCYVTQFFGCVAYSIYLNPVVAFVLLIMSAVQYLVPMAYGKIINNKMAVMSAENGRLTSKIKELILGFPVVHSYGAQKTAEKDFQTANQNAVRSGMATQEIQGLMRNTNFLIAWIMILGSVLTAGYFVLQGSMSAASLLAVFYIANCYSAPLMDCAAAYTSIKSTKAVRQKAVGILNKHKAVPAASANVLTQGLTLDHVTFSYQPDVPVLTDLSVQFALNRKYLILGESGCGKSTLLNLLSGQYPTDGVLADGTDYRSLPEGSLAGRIVLAGQRPYLFTRSVRENIDFLGVGDEERLWTVLEDCCLKEFIEELPQGVDTIVDEEIYQLSGGQKARIGLARALYQIPQVLLLDEVTAALDQETAEVIEQMLLQRSNITIIHVSHKPSPKLLDQYDEIITMEHGRIARITQNR